VSRRAPGRGGVRIARIAGIDIRADTSVIILAFLISYNLWPQFSDRFSFPGLGGGAAFAFSLLTSVLFVLSILAHELAHALTFRARGIPVLGVTLHMFGGVTEGASEAKRPWDEFIVAAAGPLTTGLLGVAFLFLRNGLQSVDPDPWRLMFTYLGRLNLIIGAFNLLPGFPLDGGRVLLAGLWRLTGDRARATRMSARVGQAVALLIGGAGLIDLVRTGNLWGIWPLMIGLMLFQSSSAALAQSRRRTALEGATVGQVMSPPPPTLPSELPISVALERHLLGHDGEAFPVIDGGRVVGFISPRMARSVPLDRTVGEAMVGTETAAMAAPEEPVSSLIRRIEGERIQTILVMKDGRLIGVIEPEDMNRFFHRRERR
jgi:Zn-dependent protease/CBS domain-containing protein